jgi:stage IV sporulation protein FB
LIKWRGVSFKVHPLFVLLMLASIATGHFLETAALFAIVLFHELGHLAMALRYGWKVKEVKLLPFGGVMEAEGAGTIPAREEAIVAIAGPLQNAVLAGGAWLAGQAGLIDPSWAEDFIRANAAIAFFNLVPVLPLDGGRIAQAWISLRLPYHKTLVWSARTSLALSGAVVLLSVFPLFLGGLLQLNLLLVGLFLCASNWSYLRNVPFVFLRFLVHRARRSESEIDGGTLAQPIVVAEHRPLSSVIHLLMKERYHLVYVMNRGKIVRVVPEGIMIDGFIGTLTNGHADSRFFM